MMKSLYYLSQLIFILSLSACGGFSAHKSGSATEGSTLEAHQVPSTKVVAVVSQNQILPNFQSCLGLSREQISEPTRLAHKESIESLSPEGEVDKVSAPMLMAVTKITSEICSDLIKVENDQSSNRKYFQNFNLANSDEGSGSVDSSINNLAASCWGRIPTPEELNIINSSILQVDTLANKTNKDAALFICTAVLSSSQAIRF